MGEADNFIQFTHLPTKCDISIYTISGELVDYIQHDDFVEGHEYWNLENKHGYPVAPGLYLYAIESDNGLKKIGKFAIVR